MRRLTLAAAVAAASCSRSCASKPMDHPWAKAEARGAASPAARDDALFASLTPEEMRAKLAESEAALERLLRVQDGSDADIARAVADKEAQDAAAQLEKEELEKNPEAAANKPLWPNCDTVEDIMDEEKYGAEGELPPISDEEHVRLAYRALGYGTVIAVIMTGASGALMAWSMGFSSWDDVKAHLRGNEQRRLAALAKFASENPDPSPEEVSKAENSIRHFTIDLTQPATLPNQLEALVSLIEELANEQQRDAAKSA